MIDGTSGRRLLGAPIQGLDYAGDLGEQRIHSPSGLGGMEDRGPSADLYLYQPRSLELVHLPGHPRVARDIPVDVGFETAFVGADVAQDLYGPSGFEYLQRVANLAYASHGIVKE